MSDLIKRAKEALVQMDLHSPFVAQVIRDQQAHIEALEDFAKWMSCQHTTDQMSSEYMLRNLEGMWDEVVEEARRVRTALHPKTKEGAS